jgi:hypothetical protein
MKLYSLQSNQKLVGYKQEVVVPLVAEPVVGGNTQVMRLENNLRSNQKLAGYVREVMEGNM